MANLTISQANFSFGHLTDWNWTLSDTVLGLTYTNNSQQKIILAGTFLVTTDSSIAGTINQVTLLQSGAEVFKVTGLSLDAKTMANLVDNVTDSTAAFAYMLGGDDTIVGSSGRDLLYGYAGNDTIVAGDGDDVIDGGSGNNMLDGGRGFDIVRYSGKLADYTIARSGIDGVLDNYTVSDNKGGSRDSLHSVEMIEFSDKVFLPIDVHGASGQIFRLYQAALDRLPDAPGIGYWEHQMESGASLTSIAREFVKSAEYQSLYGGKSNTELVNAFYQHILHRAGDQAGVDFWVGVLDRHAATTEQVLTLISDSPENVQLSVGVIGVGLVVDAPIMTL
ncbi:hypothetical protein GCM10027321_11000 [Massilia terrae]|uniref:DUF4214 domain-containing protein n=1 Tax=Massilia terrae TaxID=1811224 RepID=A0ABT2D263_9BURK|nr:DUF4214 domain-containing protein [Massilia terrae]MCS0660333.1 DUF4214 domain-containing protein [Massilia terrae]